MPPRRHLGGGIVFLREGIVLPVAKETLGKEIRSWAFGEVKVAQLESGREKISTG